MPYTTNVAGTTITAAYGNANIRDQVVTPFASASARTSAISSPVSGMVSTRTDVGVMEIYDGSAWQVGSYYPSFVVARRTSDAGSIASSTSVVDDGVLQVSVAANAVYWMEAFIVYTADQSGDLQIGWSGPASATLDWNIGGGGATNTTQTAAWYIGTNSISGTDIACGNGVSTFNAARPSGILITAGTSGTLKFRWAQGTSNVNGTQVRADSTLMLRRIG